MSLSSRKFKQEMRFVIIFIEKHSTTFVTTTIAFSRNVLLQGSGVFKTLGSLRQTRNLFRYFKCILVTLWFARTTTLSIKQCTVKVCLSRAVGDVFSTSVVF